MVHITSKQTLESQPSGHQRAAKPQSLLLPHTIAHNIPKQTLESQPSGTRGAAKSSALEGRPRPSLFCYHTL